MNLCYKEKLQQSETHQTMLDFQKMVSRYPPAHLDITKQKRESIVGKLADKLYPSHTRFTTPLNEFGSSVVLVRNEFALPYMAKEVGQFCAYLDLFYEDIKQANNVQELQVYYKQFTLKPKTLIDLLMKELDVYKEAYGVDDEMLGGNKKDLITLLKYTKEDTIEVSKIEKKARSSKMKEDERDKLLKNYKEAKRKEREGFSLIKFTD